MNSAEIIATLSLVVSVGSAVYTVVSDKAMKEWREQRQRERIAEVATEALVAVFIMTHFLTNRATDTNPDRPTAMPLQEVERQWNAAADIFDKLWLARVKVEALIPSALSAMEKLFEFAETLQVRQAAFAEAHLGRQPYDDPDTHHAFGEVPKEQIKDLHEKAKAALLRHAQLKPVK